MRRDLLVSTTTPKGDAMSEESELSEAFLNDIVKRLRGLAWLRKQNCAEDGLLPAAADRIEALEAERDRLATLVDQIVEVWDSDGQWIRGEFEVLMDTARALVGRPDCRCLDDGEVLDQRDCPLHGCDCADDQSFHDIDCPARLPLPAAPKEKP